MLDNRSIFLTSTPGWIGLKFDIFELMFYEILVMNMHNSQLVYNFLWARNKTFFLEFYMFYEIFGFITFISKQWEKVNWRPLQFRKQFLPRFFSYLQKNLTCFGVICLILYYLLQEFADFEVTVGFSKSDMFDWLLRKFENRQKLGKQLSEARRIWELIFYLCCQLAKSQGVLKYNFP